jgi:hypothetical protein
LCFVLSPAQNWFFFEIVEALRAELDAIGIRTSVSSNGFPEPAEDLVYAVVPPHEYVAVEGEAALPDPEVLARTIYICAEQPDSVHFDQNTELARRHPPGALFDINLRAVEIFNQRQLRAQHLPLGYTPGWDRFNSAPDRYVDVAFLAAQTDRRLDHLRLAGPTLARWRCELRISDNSRPNTGPSPTFIVGDQKLSLLARSRVLLNVHQGKEPYFEWLRVIEAIHCGAAVVSEHSTDYAPLVPGEHFLAGRPESLPFLVEALLEDEDRRRAIAQAAYDFLRAELPMSAAAARLGKVVEELASGPLQVADPRREPRFASRQHQRSAVAPVPHRGDAASTREQSLIRRNLRSLRLDTMDLRRRLARLEAIERSPDRLPPPRVRIVAASASWRAAQPQVTAVIPLHNQREYVGDALDSLSSSSQPRQLEIVIVNDASTDGGGDAVIDWMIRHPTVAALLVEHPINRGLPHARNTGIDFARGRYCLMLDADNCVYPRCIAALAGALEASQDHEFAYCMLECFGQVDGYLAAGGTPVINHLPWLPDRLRSGNFIDAMALIRRDRLRELGGYSTDRRLYGFEDYDMWCTMAERGWAGAHIPEILGRYRTSAVSMAGLMNLSLQEAVGAIVERHPRLMQGVQVPC